MSPAPHAQATQAQPDRRIGWIAVQLLHMLERAARQRAGEGLPGLPGSKRPEEEVLLAE